MQRQNAMRFEWRRRLHGHALFAEVEDHASGYTIEAGECRRVHPLPKRMTPVGHLVVHRGPSGLFSTDRIADGWSGWLGERLW